MLHTLKDVGEGVVPTPDSWAPTVRRPMLPGPSADTLHSSWGWLLLGTIVSAVAPVVIAILGSHGTNLGAWPWVVLGVYVSLALATGVVATASMFTARREYRHGYTTLQEFGKCGLYYRVVAQLDPRTGIEVRAANEPKLAWATLWQRYAAARASQVRPERMSRSEASEAAARARAADDLNHEIARNNSARGQLIQQFGPVAGNLRADARNIILVTKIAGVASLPLLLFSVIGAYDRHNPLLLIPYAILAACLSGTCRRHRATEDHPINQAGRRVSIRGGRGGPPTDPAVPRVTTSDRGEHERRPVGGVSWASHRARLFIGEPAAPDP